MQDMAVIRMHVSTECSQKWNTHVIAGHVTGLGSK